MPNTAAVVTPKITLIAGIRRLVIRTAAIAVIA